ncbi:hypothetical protein [Gloeobacter kilaueensis]|uniref:Uncharacterized protein n=1 Tax=Gloeobacter kilaueensis (strain ATCC BAA-2537 / CCAP 1431/1 / ULC 316 / JS1) TaxID=1183438 RepID=U5QFE4_GLOK1|nr:hypothetical protein [Gloeobacter kilaueensis]AGY56390.1 hypothetical protein GKIL_0143 [Gloeobacter kilaueensis JS1]
MESVLLKLLRSGGGSAVTPAVEMGSLSAEDVQQMFRRLLVEQDLNPENWSLQIEVCLPEDDWPLQELAYIVCRVRCYAPRRRLSQFGLLRWLLQRQSKAA